MAPDRTATAPWLLTLAADINNRYELGLRDCDLVQLARMVEKATKRQARQGYFVRNEADALADFDNPRRAIGLVS